MSDPRRSAYLSAVYHRMQDALHYPLNTKGDVLDTTPFRDWVCRHLVQEGWRHPHDMELMPDYDVPLIKKRRVYGPGMYVDAVTWVPYTAPDDPLEHLDDMTMAEIEALEPEDVRLEAKRRLGMIPTPEPNGEPLQPAWSVQPYINITDAPAEPEWSTHASTR